MGNTQAGRNRPLATRAKIPPPASGPKDIWGPHKLEVPTRSWWRRGSLVHPWEGHLLTDPEIRLSDTEHTAGSH